MFDDADSVYAPLTLPMQFNVFFEYLVLEPCIYDEISSTRYLT